MIGIKPFVPWNQLLQKNSFTKIGINSAQSREIYNPLKTNGLLEDNGNVTSDVNKLHPNGPLDLGDLNAYKKPSAFNCSRNKTGSFFEG